MEIKIYTSPLCTWCGKLKEWLKKRKLSFEEHDMSDSEELRDMVLERTGQLVYPVIEIDGTLIQGFDEKALTEIVDKNQAEQLKVLNTAKASKRIETKAAAKIQSKKTVKKVVKKKK
ncbi:glutathione S-transferase N-terminal domain-containing protein [Candidatus Woesearchaeota archaeon]|nr:glutathione S-transferase N-terminal domain-containing protein [Candidatus Woesearchaeota archaeon]